MIRAIRLPIPWLELGFPCPFAAGGITLRSGRRGWTWDGAAPDLDLGSAGAPEDPPAAPPWTVDHVVLLVPHLEGVLHEIAAAGGDLRRRVVVRGRATAFFRAGVMLEVIEEGNVERPLLWGIALAHPEPLDAVARRWQESGWEVRGPRPALQPHRRILTVSGLDAGLAVLDLPPTRGD